MWVNGIQIKDKPRGEKLFLWNDRVENIPKNVVWKIRWICVTAGAGGEFITYQTPGNEEITLIKVAGSAAYQDEVCIWLWSGCTIDATNGSEYNCVIEEYDRV